jgi:hypothetical protein
MKDRVKTGKIRRKAQLVGTSSNGAFYWVRTKPAVIQFVGWSSSFDVASKEPNELAWLEVGGRIVVAVVSTGLNLLCVL